MRGQYIPNCPVLASSALCEAKNPVILERESSVDGEPLNPWLKVGGLLLISRGYINDGGLVESLEVWQLPGCHPAIQQMRAQLIELDKNDGGRFH
jgi:hypothetical protein